MNEGLALHLPPFSNNAPFVSLTRVSLSNTNFGTVFKLGGHGDGPPTLCMNFVGLGQATMITLIGKKTLFGGKDP